MQIDQRDEESEGVLSEPDHAPPPSLQQVYVPPCRRRPPPIFQPFGQTFAPPLLGGTPGGNFARYPSPPGRDPGWRGDPP
ncbi:hypothetical protein WJX73_000649 [Symbiochloris irregularis]|uniref:Uncharacterized protein n=1 Tax=Symbiochloris irregularis TaxID=706552 RepID=A0AAW1NUX0_9CHLO